MDRISSKFWNEDFEPVAESDRKWGLWDIAALWVGMSICIPTYMLAGSLLNSGMNIWQAIFTIFLGNAIVVIPMILNASAGTKYGIPFPVLIRSSFGIVGSNLPALMRAIVACGWFGIQTWIGGSAIHQILSATLPFWQELPIVSLGFFGSQPLGAWLGFIVFWIMNIYIVIKGPELIRKVEDFGAPFLLLTGIALLIWAYFKAGGFGPIFSEPAKFGLEGYPKTFWIAFFPSLTAMVGYWATLSLNIPDFTRYAKSQKDQILGQLLGLNTTMPLYAFIGAAVTSSTYLIFGRFIWDPVELLAQFKNPFVVVISLLGLIIATLTTNIAANVVAPANSFSNIAPKLISYKTGGIITGIIGILMMPWKLIADPKGYIFTWLIGYSALLGPIAGIMIADYFIVKKKKIYVDELFIQNGRYWYFHGWNLIAVIALVFGIIPNIPGFLITIEVIKPVDSLAYKFFKEFYNYAWFTGFFISFIVYSILKKWKQ
ncbi:MAG: NCS1 family nucleobase:cation symporter-1 [bacterium]|nr:NCS1 family nucleobase:cation symporter-1 [bacterium]